MCNEISNMYKKYNLSIKFEQYSGCFVTGIYQEHEYTRIYRNIKMINYHNPVFSRSYNFAEWKENIRFSKTKTSICC